MYDGCFGVHQAPLMDIMATSKALFSNETLREFFKQLKAKTENMSPLYAAMRNTSSIFTAPSGKSVENMVRLLSGHSLLTRAYYEFAFLFKAKNVSAAAAITDDVLILVGEAVKSNAPVPSPSATPKLASPASVGGLSAPPSRNAEHKHKGAAQPMPPYNSPAVAAADEVCAAVVTSSLADDMLILPPALASSQFYGIGAAAAAAVGPVPPRVDDWRAQVAALRAGPMPQVKPLHFTMPTPPPTPSSPPLVRQLPPKPPAQQQQPLMFAMDDVHEVAEEEEEHHYHEDQEEEEERKMEKLPKLQQADRATQMETVFRTATNGKSGLYMSNKTQCRAPVKHGKAVKRCAKAFNQQGDLCSTHWNMVLRAIGVQGANGGPAAAE